MPESEDQFEKITILVPKGTRERIKDDAKSVNLATTAYCRMWITFNLELEDAVKELNDIIDKNLSDADFMRFVMSFNKKISLYRPKLQIIKEYDNRIDKISKLISQRLTKSANIESTGKEVESVSIKEIKDQLVRQRDELSKLIDQINLTGGC